MTINNNSLSHKGRGSKVKEIPKLSWIIGRSAGSTQPSLGRVSLSLHSCQNPQFGMTINNIPLLEIKDFGPPARGGHFVRQSHKGRGNKAPSSKSKISVLPQGVDILCFFTPFYPLSHTARSFTRFILHRFNQCPHPTSHYSLKHDKGSECFGTL